jgi:SAM-dependent methyltransferase
MDGPWSNLKLYVTEPASPVADGRLLHPLSPSLPAVSPAAPSVTPDPAIVANRELIRPVGYRGSYRRDDAGLVPFSAAWYDELEQKRYQRHGVWLPTALEFGRHPGESLLLLGAGLGSDAIRYVRTGTLVTIGVSPNDYSGPLRENLARQGVAIRIVEMAGRQLPFANGAFDVVAWNALYDTAPPGPAQVSELFRVLKPGGKVIGLFPARFDAGYWQDLVLPLQWVYWRRPIDPTTAPKTTARQLARLFGGFSQHRFAKRHLRRGELPHLWRMLPLLMLERLMGRVLVFKALKPLSARPSSPLPLAA